MATTQLAAGTSVTNSSDIVVSDSPVKVGLFVASGAVPSDAVFEILSDTPGSGDNIIGRLGGGTTELVISGPGTYRVRRNYSAGVSVGVYSEP